MGAGALPGALLPLLPLQQPLLLQPILLQPHHLLHVHANPAAHHRSHLSGKDNQQAKTTFKNISNFPCSLDYVQEAAEPATVVFVGSSNLR